jgi:hypothetical protein
MGRHHEDDPERRRQGGLRWKGDTSDQIPVVPLWESHQGITEETVQAFTAGLRSTNPPGTDVSPEHARYSWMIERASDRAFSGQPARAASWVRMASGYSATPYVSTTQAAVDILDCWLRWNHVTDPAVRVLHTIWVRHATEAAWTERLDGR